MQEAGRDAEKKFWDPHIFGNRPSQDNSATHHSEGGHQRGANAQILHPHQSTDFDQRSTSTGRCLDVSVTTHAVES